MATVRNQRRRGPRCEIFRVRPEPRRLTWQEITTIRPAVALIVDRATPGPDPQRVFDTIMGMMGWYVGAGARDLELRTIEVARVVADHLRARLGLPPRWEGVR